METIKRKVFSAVEDAESGETRLYSTTDITLEAEEERLYSTGDDELDELMERAFCDGYEYFQEELEREFSEDGEGGHLGRNIALGVGGTAGAGLAAAGGYQLNEHRKIKKILKKLEGAPEETVRLNDFLATIDKLQNIKDNKLNKKGVEIENKAKELGEEGVEAVKKGGKKAAKYAKEGGEKVAKAAKELAEKIVKKGK